MRFRLDARMACVLITVLIASLVMVKGELYPSESEARLVHSLDGIWQFRLVKGLDTAMGHREQWYKQELRETGDTIPMPVPASYNDITEEKDIRDHVGVVWYDRTFYVPGMWNTGISKILLRFGSVHYSADVYVNGELVVSHAGGHVPFQVDVTSVLQYGQKNLISVAVNNTLTSVTVPQGSLSMLETDNGTKIVQDYTFDFFNYAGIHRSVLLYVIPSVHIDDVAVNTDMHGATGVVSYSVAVAGETSGTPVVSVSLLDRDGKYVVQDVQGLQGELEVPQAKLWWPYLMDSDPAYLYTLEVRLSTGGDVPEDVYRLPVGIRKLEWSSTGVSINGKPMYIRGFGRHEDSNIRGKGHDFPLIARDYNLIKWLGANAYRTSHYPYSEEIMDFADREGIMIIDECAAVNIGSYGLSDELLEAHKTALTRLYNRDKNRPSVVIWSVANEAQTNLDGADTYFSEIADHMKALDSSRPITMAMVSTPSTDKAAGFMDVIGVNRYNAWYTHGGRIDTIIPGVVKEAEEWHKKYNKPILMTEYGADTIPGLHLSPDYMWSEEYQVKLISKHFEAFDQLRDAGYFFGEMIWNFADFNTAQFIIRVGGNKKGIFTRDRQPKSSAHLMRKRYWAMAEELDSVTPPDDIDDYVSAERRKRLRNSLYYIM